MRLGTPHFAPFLLNNCGIDDRLDNVLTFNLKLKDV